MLMTLFKENNPEQLIKITTKQFELQVNRGVLHSSPKLHLSLSTANSSCKWINAIRSTFFDGMVLFARLRDNTLENYALVSISM